jgi:hypothetical protein
MKLNISTKLQLLVAAFGLATFVIVAGAYLLIDAKSADGLQINLAGRQRMLSQRMSKEALSLASAETSARKQAAGTLAKTVELFDKTLIALHKGGTTKGGDGKPVQLPAAEGAKSKAPSRVARVSGRSSRRGFVGSPPVAWMSTAMRARRLWHRFRARTSSCSSA